MPTWKPGETPYALWINNLRETDPEGYKQHLLERKARKSLKQDMAALVQAQRAGLLAMFFNKGIDLVASGGVQEFTAVYDRFIGKPDTTMDVTSNGQTLQAPTIIFTPRELDEWKDTTENE